MLITLVQVNVTHLWTLVAAFLVSFSFVFKSVMSSMFDSVIFMFVVHPYDVGDGILVNGDLYKVSYPFPLEFPLKSTEIY